MGDQLLSSDTLAVQILLLNRDDRARRRMPIETLERSIPTFRAMLSAGGWESKITKRYLRWASDQLALENEAGLVGGIPFRTDPEGFLRGNYGVWVAVREILAAIDDDLAKNTPLHQIHSSRLVYSINSMISRSGLAFTQAERISMTNRFMSESDKITSLSSFEAYLWELHEIRAKEHNRNVRLSKEIEEEYGEILFEEKHESDPLDDLWDSESNDSDDDTLSSKSEESEKVQRTLKYIHDTTDDGRLLDKDKVNILVRKKIVDMAVIGPLVYLKIKSKEVILTKTHFERVTKILRSFYMFILSAMDMRLTVSPFRLIVDLVDSWWTLIEEDTDFLGEALKGARQIMISKLDTSNVSGQPPLKSYLSAIDPKRASYALYYASILESKVHSLFDAINLTNLFKVVPHPDTNMYQLFLTIEGVKTPNPVNEKKVSRFVGTMRRSIYKSLAAQKVQVRVFATSEIGQRAEDLTEATRKQGTVVGMLGHNTWAATSFHKLRDFVDIMSIDVNPSSKSSQIRIPFTEEDLIESAGYAADIGENPPEFYKTAKTVNDAASSLMGEDNLAAGEAIEHFKYVIKLHEDFESRFPGLTIDDIPSEELSSFLMSNDAAAYLVGTEPKFGEVHKKVTRMFYMAEQRLKAVTQRVERYTKQVSRRQPGVSITKSYPARRKDLEAFCRNMRDTSDDIISYFISFDMSEFSKKFPMRLVREYGNILSELTGESWLKRIDVVFRASVVIHNSRGFFAHLAGVRGGFEGFYNFVWSSIHSTIMEIALESTGLSGEVLVFSDDGCLSFYAPAEIGREEVWRRVLKVQQVYADYGLTFHLGKSLVSTHVWEYLGDVCHNHRLVPMWIKEVSSITRTTKTRGIEPFYSKIKSIQAQTDAAIMAGAPPDIMYILKRFLFGCELDRLGISYDPRLEEVLCVVPTSAGGLRITSPFEASTITTIEKDSEIMADLYFLSIYDPQLCNSVVSSIQDNLRHSDNIASAIISGSRFVTNHPDTSGMRAVNDLIDLVRVSDRVVKQVPDNPLDLRFQEQLYDILETLTDINLDIITSLIFATPKWVEYGRAMSLVRSSGVLRLVPRRDVRRIQGEERRRVKLSISMWREAIRDPVMSSRIPDPKALINRAKDIVFGRLSIAKLRPSPRMALRIGDGRNGIQVKTDYTRAESLYSQTYVEPRLQLSKDTTMIGWFSESTGDYTLRSTRQFLNSVARALSHSPESEPAIRALSTLMGIDVPVLPVELTRSAHRLGRAVGRDVDCKISLPRWFMANTSSRYFGPLSEKLYQEHRADRTTYLECAKVLAYLYRRCDHNRMLGVKDDVILTNFIIDETYYRPMHKFRPMGIKEGCIVKTIGNPVSQRLTDEFIASYIEYIETNSEIAIVTHMSETLGKITGAERMMMLGLYKTAMYRWLFNAYMHSSSSLVPSITLDLPQIEMSEVLVSAIIQTTLSAMDPKSRRRLMDHVNEAYYRMRNAQEEYGENLLTLQEFTEFMHLTSNILLIIEGIAPKNYPIESIREIFANPQYIFKHIADYSQTVSLLQTSNLIVIKGESYIKGKMTPSHRMAMREAFTSTLSNIYAFGRANQWDPAEFRKQLGIYTNIDVLINGLIVLRGILRESEHRDVDHPYNTTTSRIEMVKFYMSVDSTLLSYFQTAGTLLELDDEELEENLASFILPPNVAEYIKRREGLGPDDSDHLRMLMMPQQAEAVRRALYLVKAAKSGNYFGVGSRSFHNNGRFFDYSYDEVCSELSSFYAVLIGPTVRRMTEYSTELERAVLEQFSPSTKTMAELMNLTTDEKSLLSEQIKLSDLQRSDALGLTRVVKGHLLDICDKTLVKGLSVRAGGDEYILRMVGEYEIEDGPLVELYSRDVVYESSYYVYILRSANPSHIISDYVNLMSTGVASASLLYNTGNREYMLVGVSSEYIIPGVTDREVVINTSIPITALFTSMAFEGGSVPQSQLARLFDATAPRGEITRNMFATQYAKIIQGYKQVNNISPILQAAVDEVKDNYCQSTVLAVYSVALCVFTSDCTIDQIKQVAAKIQRDYNHMAKHDQVSLLRDMSTTATWFALSSIGQGPDIHTDDINLFRLELRKIKSSIRVFPQIVQLTPAMLPDIYASLRGKRIGSLLGHLSDNLFVPEPVFVLSSGDRQIEDSKEDSPITSTDLIDDLW